MSLSTQFRQSLVALRHQKGWTQEEVARKLNMTLRGYQRIEQRGKTTSDTIERLAEIFEVGVPTVLTYGSEEIQLMQLQAVRHQVPILKSVLLGEMGVITGLSDEHSVYTEYARQPNTFALRVKDDSMEPEMKKGDIVVVAPDVPFVNNKPYAVALTKVGDMLRLVRETENGYWLIPVNIKYEQVHAEAKDVIRLCKVLEIIRHP